MGCKMWIKDYRGRLYNANNFKTFTTEISDVVCHRLYGVEQNGRKVVLLEYLSLSLDANYEGAAMTMIESGIANGDSIVRLTNLCKYDYTVLEEEDACTEQTSSFSYTKQKSKPKSEKRGKPKRK